MLLTADLLTIAKYESCISKYIFSKFEFSRLNYNDKWLPTLRLGVWVWSTINLIKMLNCWSNGKESLGLKKKSILKERLITKNNVKSYKKQKYSIIDSSNVCKKQARLYFLNITFHFM